MVLRVAHQHTEREDHNPFPHMVFVHSAVVVEANLSTVNTR